MQKGIKSTRHGKSWETLLEIWVHCLGSSQETETKAVTRTEKTHCKDLFASPRKLTIKRGKKVSKGPISSMCRQNRQTDRHKNPAVSSRQRECKINWGLERQPFPTLPLSSSQSWDSDFLKDVMATICARHLIVVKKDSRSPGQNYSSEMTGHGWKM